MIAIPQTTQTRPGSSPPRVCDASVEPPSRRLFFFIFFLFISSSSSSSLHLFFCRLIVFFLLISSSSSSYSSSSSLPLPLLPPAMADYSQSAAGGSSGSSSDFVRVPSFVLLYSPLISLQVKKLFKMLEDPSYRDVVRWSDAGDSFVVIEVRSHLSIFQSYTPLISLLTCIKLTRSCLSRPTNSQKAYFRVTSSTPTLLALYANSTNMTFTKCAAQMKVVFVLTARVYVFFSLAYVYVCYHNINN